MVLHELAELELEFEEKNVGDKQISDELFKIGGDRQTPCLVDDNHHLVIYESRDIVEHLVSTYGDGKGRSKSENVAPNVCIPKEETSS
jgi:glutathione S-transferase